MGMLNVQVWDATGNKRQEVEMPDDAPVTTAVRSGAGAGRLMPATYDGRAMMSA